MDQFTQALITIGVGLVVFSFGQIFLRLILEPLVTFRSSLRELLIFLNSDVRLVLISIMKDLELTAERAETLHKEMPFELGRLTEQMVVSYKLVPLKPVLVVLFMLPSKTKITKARRWLLEMIRQAGHGRWKDKKHRDAMFSYRSEINKVFQIYDIDLIRQSENIQDSNKPSK